MLAMIAAVVFGLALLLDLVDVGSPLNLITLGLLLIALHLAGVGAGTSWRTGSWNRSRRTARR